MAIKKTRDEEGNSAPSVTTEEMLMHLRGEIRKEIRAGLQTHEAQDGTMRLLRLVDAIDAAIRLGD